MSEPSERTTQSPAKSTIAGVTGLGAACIFASLAIDRGNLAYYALTVLSIYIGVRYLLSGIKQFNKKK